MAASFNQNTIKHSCGFLNYYGSCWDLYMPDKPVVMYAEVKTSLQFFKSYQMTVESLSLMYDLPIFIRCPTYISDLLLDKNFHRVNLRTSATEILFSIFPSVYCNNFYLRSPMEILLTIFPSYQLSNLWSCIMSWQLLCQRVLYSLCSNQQASESSNTL